MKLLTKEEMQRLIKEGIDDPDAVVDVETAKEIIKEAVLPLCK